MFIERLILSEVEGRAGACKALFDHPSTSLRMSGGLLGIAAYTLWKSEISRNRKI